MIVRIAASVVVASVIFSAVPEIEIPDEHRNPSGKMVAASVHVWSPRHIAASVHVWSPAGSVRGLESTEKQGETTVVTLRSDVLFAFGSAEISPDAMATIAELADDIPEGATASVTGHTDNIGTDAENLVLSLQRAEAVAAAMNRTDVTLNVEGLGASAPVASNSEPDGRQQNRRVEIRYEG